MPADSTIPQAPSARHSDASQPYPCSARDLSIAPWAIDHGACRTSLDYQADKRGALLPLGSGDPRCPADCKNRAPLHVAKGFMDRWPSGLHAAIVWVKQEMGRP